ncbi:undecaprenyl-diphosphate phosphatase [Candidatus Daviesbacteria bacterium]|nr:undecaprenyl-diphosphate phosphatase [Candidatus Daviesbacteria bacterium]
MDIFQAIFLSIIEGITEFLPISSTGHLILASNLLEIPQTEFAKSFEIIIQLGAILSVIVLYWKRIYQNFALWRNIVIAFIPTAAIGLLFYKMIKDVFFENIWITIFALLIGGILLILIEKLHKEKDSHTDSLEKLTLKQSFLIGVAQSFSIIPGTSRAAATIIGGLLVGTKRKVAVEFSFLLAVPTMAAATGLDLIKSNFSFTGMEILILVVGFSGSFITALFVVKWFIKFIGNNNFIWFGVYRIALSLIFILLLLD